jgi:hypothetical protein
MSNKLVQTIMVGVLAVGLCSQLAKTSLGRLLLWVIFIVAVGACAIVWLRRYHPSLLIRAYRMPVPKKVIDVICKWSGQQVLEAELKTAEYDPLAENLLPKTNEDFDSLKNYLNEEVQGHGEAINALIDELWKGVNLRLRSPGRSQLPPICSILLFGPDGVGKRFLAASLGQSFFNERSFACVDLRGADASSPQLAQLIETVRVFPHSVLILENLSLAASEVVDLIQRVLVKGDRLGSAHGASVTFQSSVLILVEHAQRNEAFSEFAKSFDSTDTLALQKKDWLRLPAPFLDVIHPILMPLPTIHGAARICAMQAKRESEKHGMHLEKIAPEKLLEWSNVLLKNGASATLGMIAKETKVGLNAAQRLGTSTIQIS